MNQRGGTAGAAGGPTRWCIMGCDEWASRPQVELEQKKSAEVTFRNVIVQFLSLSLSSLDDFPAEMLEF